MAQDIQKVLPELVQTDENGMMSIDYIGFIPLIVESIKEMQQTIQQQNEVIDNLQALLSPEVQSQLRSNTTSTSNISAVDGAKLYNRKVHLSLIPYRRRLCLLVYRYLMSQVNP